MDKIIGYDYVKNTGFTNKKKAIEFAKLNNIKLERFLKNDTKSIKKAKINRFLSSIRIERIKTININKLKNYTKNLKKDTVNQMSESSKKKAIIDADVKKFNNGEIDTFQFTLDDLNNYDTISILVSIKQAMNKLLIAKLKMNHDLVRYITLSNYYKTKLEKLLEGESGEAEGLGLTGSDDGLASIGYSIKIHTIIIYNKDVEDMFDDENKPKKINKTKEGNFFKYTTINGLAKIDLSRYQIFNDIKNGNYNDNCLVHSLTLSGMDEININWLKINCRCAMIPKKNIKSIAEKADYNIIVRYIDSKNNDNYNKLSKRKIELGLIDEHYFVIEKTNITYFSINNYEKVKDQVEWNRIIEIRDGKFKYTDSKFMNSFDLIKLLLENYKKHGSDSDLSLIKPITMCIDTLKTCYPDKFNNKIETLEYNSKLNTKPITYTPRINKIDIIVGFDFETRTDLATGHEPYLVCYRIYNKDKLVTSKTIYGKKCGKEMLFNVYKYCESNCKGKEYNVTFMAHNVSYDARFLYDHVFQIKLINRSANNICGGDFRYRPFGVKDKSMLVHLKDTYAILPFQLKQFKDIFKFEYKKEIMPYEIYNNESIYLDYPKYSIENACKFLESSEIDDFINNIREWKLDNNDGTFNHIEYSRIYCEKDVEVMCEGYFTLKKWLQKDFKLDLNNYLTISSIADSFLQLKGCYDDCYQLSGIPRYFIQKCMVGGRTMLKNNTKYDSSIDKDRTNINDLDGVSLYPSSMSRIPGFLKGLPKVIKKEDMNMNFLNSVDYYYVEIKLSKIGIKRDFSLISRVNKDGIRVFDNEVDFNYSYHVDKVTLDDMINFQKVEFTIIGGYYFNEGFNNKINKVITKIFNKRVEYKNAGNPIQELYKLIMNSSYGKTLLKEKPFKYTFFDNEKTMIEFIYRNYNYIMEVVPLSNNKKYKVKSVVPISDHFNACHIGVQILSMSKRIMNEVMCLAEDMSINIYYQDTDSMHIEDNKINSLSNAFRAKYNRELIGKGLGQFHVDFEAIKGVMPIADETITLGKKAYIDKLKYVIDGKDVFKYHYRMKGVPQNVVLKKAHDEFGGDLMKLYRELFNGKSIDFDLLSCGIKFDMCSNMTVKSKTKFIRKIKF